MTAWWIGVGVGMLGAIVVAWLVPGWAMRRLLPVLERSGRVVTNYSGREVILGLGVVWLVWCVGYATVSALLSNAAWYSQSLLAESAGTSAELLPIAMQVSITGLPTLLVAGAFAFGLLDDMFDSGGSKGFRGHLVALREGAVTTGALKLIGIGTLALIAGASAAARVGRLNFTSSISRQPGWSIAVGLGAWLLGALVIALAANLVNLTDLRPGRALKTYSLLVLLGVCSTAWRLWYTYDDTARFLSEGPGQTIWALSGALVLAVLLLGPVVAVWRYDLGERAMLGDAGANAMGALAGYVLASSLPLWLLAIVAAVLLALNLASERVSFSRVIEERPLLRWIDGLGRLAADRPGEGDAGNLVKEGEGRVATDADVTDTEQGRDGGN